MYYNETKKMANVSHMVIATVKPVLSGHSQKDQKWVFKTNDRLMQVKSKWEHSAILSTCIELSHGFKTFVLSFFE